MMGLEDHLSGPGHLVHLQVFYQIPFAMVQLIQAVLVICVASSDFFIRHRIRRVQGED